VLTATGAVSMHRVNFVCRRCRLGRHPLDERLGVRHSMSPQAERLLCLAGASWSFDCSAKYLKELCGLSVSDNTIREVCQKQAGTMAQWQRESAEASQPFQAAKGDVEFTTDGTCVNTWEGWREMRLGIFSKRLPGPPASAEQWSKRELPTAHVRLAFAAIEKSGRFGKRWSRWAQRLNLRDTACISVLADGARWIWEETAMHFAGASEVLDIYHALEHVADTAKVLYGEGTEAAKSWTDQGRQTLLSKGWPGIFELILETRKTLTKNSHRRSLKALSGYLGYNSKRLVYARRLAEGRSIGSGQAEGACKHMIGRRLKQTGARWRFRRVNRMATVCCLLYSDHWDAYWART
jgi:hypothetical protein